MNNTRFTATEKIAAIAFIIFVNICFLIPVWQNAVNSQIRSRIAQTEEQINLKQEQKMSISAKIAKQTTPEYLIEMAAVQNISFTQINGDNTYVASSMVGDR